MQDSISNCIKLYESIARLHQHQTRRVPCTGYPGYYGGMLRDALQTA